MEDKEPFDAKDWSWGGRLNGKPFKASEFFEGKEAYPLQREIKELQKQQVEDEEGSNAAGGGVGRC